MITPRQAAVQAILAIDRGENAQAALAKAASSLSPIDAPLCSDLVYGLLRNRSRVQARLAQLLAKPNKLPPVMRASLELAAYSMLYQDRVPSYAAVNETVKYVKRISGQKMANVANAVLRKLRDDSDEPHDVFPSEITELWEGAYGKENARRLVERSLERPWSALRVNRLHENADDLAAALAAHGEPVGVAGLAFAPGQMPKEVLNRELSSWLLEGALSRQAAGSQVILKELGIFDDWRGAPIWDACSGVGGKTFAMLEAGLTVALATDNSLRRLQTQAREAARLGLAGAPRLLANAGAPPIHDWSGHILADVPCTGLGVLARRPDLIGRWDSKKRQSLMETQRRILLSLAEKLRPGRELCYMTCALDPAENEEQIAWILGIRPDLCLRRQWQTPHDHPWLEGMYGARLVKER